MRDTRCDLLQLFQKGICLLTLLELNFTRGRHCPGVQTIAVWNRSVGGYLKHAEVISS